MTGSTLVPSMASLPFKGRVGVGMVFPVERLMLSKSSLRKFDTLNEATPSPPNPPLERESFKPSGGSTSERCRP